ncbi:Beta-1,3-galactosyltransferase 5 [Chionoecetes opilio]|uniref:Hexosyltransferase n=1 Tax=Chionoecetes opilio TaxID=41210 RepID=A0A8J5CLG3_CHIOP|nr:Beta-1,3-galactosyltransferase 5 [Chionoecetes opilio]
MLAAYVDLKKAFDSVHLRRVRLVPLRWVVVTCLAFLFSYLFIPRPARVIQLEWPWGRAQAGVREAEYTHKALMEEAMLSSPQNWTYPAATSHDPRHHPHRFSLVLGLGLSLVLGLGLRLGLGLGLDLVLGLVLGLGLGLVLGLVLGLGLGLVLGLVLGLGLGSVLGLRLGLVLGFIYSRKRLNITSRPKVNRIPEQVQWRHSPPDHLCRAPQPPPLALALVVSGVGQGRRRTFIRDTWARAAWYPHTCLKVVFVLGSTVDVALQTIVDEEARTHTDIVQYNFIDSYANLTYKSLSLLTWGTSRCPEALFYAKIDDDVLVNPFHLRTFLQESLQHPPSPKGVLPNDQLFHASPDTNPATTYIYGRYDAHPFPLRKTKWALSVEEYPEKVFPPFVHGPAYLLGGAAARQLLRVAPYVPLVKLEDVYMTGLVALAAGVRHVQIYGRVSTFKAGPSLYNGTHAILEETGRQGREAAWQEIVKYAPKV